MESTVPYLLSSLTFVTAGSACNFSSKRLFTTKNRPVDCPLCIKYGQGRCGKRFWEWYDCTNDKEDENLCLGLFEVWQECHQQQQLLHDPKRGDNMNETDENNNMQEYDEDNHIHSLIPGQPDEVQIRDAWETMIRDELPLTKPSFPIKPCVDWDNTGRTLTVFFSIRAGSPPLVLVYCRDETTWLRAASAASNLKHACLWSVSFAATTMPKRLTITAVYEPENEGDDLCVYEENVECT
jgi:hypothetical protein